MNCFFVFVLKKKKGNNPSEKVIIVVKKLNHVDVDDIADLEDLPTICDNQ